MVREGARSRQDPLGLGGRAWVQWRHGKWCAAAGGRGVVLPRGASAPTCARGGTSGGTDACTRSILCRAHRAARRL